MSYSADYAVELERLGNLMTAWGVEPTPCPRCQHPTGHYPWCLIGKALALAAAPRDETDYLDGEPPAAYEPGDYA